MPVLQFSRRYSMAHRLILGTSEKCAIPHGHNEIVTVELEPLKPLTLGGVNALAPFEAVKGRWHAWIDGAVDHALQLNAADPLIGYFLRQEPERAARIMTFPGDPTTEAQAVLMFAKLQAFLAADAAPYRAARLRIEETPTNAVLIDERTLAALELPERGWFRRPDQSINDLGQAPRLALAEGA